MEAQIPTSSPSKTPVKRSLINSLMEATTTNNYGIGSPSFKEDTYVLSNLKQSEKRSLIELRNKLSSSHSSQNPTMWNIPLLPVTDKSDVILLKFLRARDFKVTDAYEMLEKSLTWRKEFMADGILEEELGFKELEGLVAYMHGFDKEGHPVCYNAYGVFKDREMYERYIRPEDVPVHYGGLSRPGDLQNGPAKPASEFTVKGGEKVNIQIEGIEADATITWDLVVGGWELDYSAEFIPNAKDSYSIAVEKLKKLSSSDEAVHNSFLAREAGKLVLSVDNTASRRRKVAAYRYVVRKSTLI
ncbi:hypothetical protein KSS87_009557 [Heliosperma pusillum]|nr:hypothetical protein KSS87_009557 [Heliosperma pusillum]